MKRKNIVKYIILLITIVHILFFIDATDCIFFSAILLMISFFFSYFILIWLKKRYIFKKNVIIFFMTWWIHYGLLLILIPNLFESKSHFNEGINKYLVMFTELHSRKASYKKIFFWKFSIYNYKNLLNIFKKKKLQLTFKNKEGYSFYSNADEYMANIIKIYNLHKKHYEVVENFIELVNSFPKSRYIEKMENIFLNNIKNVRVQKIIKLRNNYEQALYNFNKISQKDNYISLKELKTGKILSNINEKYFKGKIE